MKTINDEITLTNVIDKLNVWISDVQFDLTEDWNSRKTFNATTVTTVISC